jgi:hypothetical protein
MNLLAHLSWSHASALAILASFALFAICCYLERRVRRWKARRRRHLLNRLNRPSYFKTMENKYYRAGKLR